MEGVLCSLPYIKPSSTHDWSTISGCRREVNLYLDMGRVKKIVMEGAGKLGRLDGNDIPIEDIGMARIFCHFQGIVAGCHGFSAVLDKHKWRTNVAEQEMAVILIDTPLGFVEDAASIGADNIFVFVNLFGNEFAIEGYASGEVIMPMAVAVSDNSNSLMGNALHECVAFFGDVSAVIDQEGKESLFHSISIQKM